MIAKNEPRMRVIALCDVVFYEDIPVLLGVSKLTVAAYLRNDGRGADEYFAKHPFPMPFYVSPSGVRLWWRSDLEKWCRGIRLKRTSLRMKRFGAFLDRPELVELVFGK